MLAKQNINVIFTTVGLFNELFTYNRKNLNNYFEIYIKTNIKKLKSNKSKYFYRRNTTNVWGVDLKPQFPKKPHIIVENNFDQTVFQLTKLIFEKIRRLN